MEDEELSPEQLRKISILSHSLLNCVLHMIGEQKVTPHESITILCNAFWGLILVCSSAKDAVSNIEDAFEVMEENYKHTKKVASEMTWKHFADMNGVGNS
jgi:hypothetical protein